MSGVARIASFALTAWLVLHAHLALAAGPTVPPTAPAHAPATALAAPVRLRGAAGLREAFRLDLKRTLAKGAAQGMGRTLFHGLLAGIATKIGLGGSALAAPVALVTLPLVSSTSSRFGWRNGDVDDPRRFLGFAFRLTTRLGVGIRIGWYASWNLVWNGFDVLRGRPTLTVVERYRLRERAGE